MKFIRIDADNIGDHIELALMENNIEKANLIHTSVQKGMLLIKEKLAFNPDFQILMVGCDDILFAYSGDERKLDILDSLMSDFFAETSFTLSIGIGDDLSQAMFNLKIAKLSGKNKIVSR